jgi:hypothetical protein
MPTARPLRHTRSSALHTVTGTLSLSGYADGQAHDIEVVHSAVATEENADLVGRFADNPVPWFARTFGFAIEPLLDGMNGDQFKVRVTCDIDEYVYYYGSEADADGAATLIWYRRGVLSDDAG